MPPRFSPENPAFPGTNSLAMSLPRAQVGARHTRRGGVDMFARFAVTVIVMLAMSAPAWAQDREDLQIFRDISRQVLQYPHFTIFDSVNAEVEEGVVVLSGKVTMPYKVKDIEERVARVNG